MPKMPTKDPISAIQAAMEVHAETKAQEAGAAVAMCVSVLIDTLRGAGKMNQSDVEIFIQKLAMAVAASEMISPSKVISTTGLTLARYLTKRSAN